MKYLTISQAALATNTTQSKIMDSIRMGDLRVHINGTDIVISNWDLSSFNPAEPRFFGYSNLCILATIYAPFPKAHPYSTLFDQAFFAIEKQHERVLQDLTNLRYTHQQVWSSLDERVKGIPNMPNQDVLTPNLTLFMDLQFFFVAREQLRKSIERLHLNLQHPGMDAIYSKYITMLNSIKKIRGMTEHLADKQIDSPAHGGDFGNLDEKGYHFGGKYYSLYFEELHELKDDLSDFLIKETAPKV